MTLITSRANPLVKAIVQLHAAKYRVKEQKFIAEGLRTVKTLLEFGITPDCLVGTPQTIEQIRALSDKAPIHAVSTEVMAKISTAVQPSGILGVFYMPSTPPLADIGPGLVCANITTPGNLGTLIRTAAACNVRTVVCIDGCDPWSPKVVHASAGTLGAVSIFRITWDQLVQNKKNIPLCALVVAGGDTPHNLDTSNSLLVVGNEAHGLPDQWLADCQQKLTLPMPGKTESLNAAVAGSIALYATILMRP